MCCIGSIWGTGTCVNNVCSCSKGLVNKNALGEPMCNPKALLPSEMGIALGISVCGIIMCSRYLIDSRRRHELVAVQPLGSSTHNVSHSHSSAHVSSKETNGKSSFYTKATSFIVKSHKNGPHHRHSTIFRGFNAALLCTHTLMLIHAALTLAGITFENTFFLMPLAMAFCMGRMPVLINSWLKLLPKIVLHSKEGQQAQGIEHGKALGGSHHLTSTEIAMLIRMRDWFALHERKVSCALVCCYLSAAVVSPPFGPYIGFLFFNIGGALAIAFVCIVFILSSVSALKVYRYRLEELDPSDISPATITSRAMFESMVWKLKGMLGFSFLFMGVIGIMLPIALLIPPLHNFLFHNMELFMIPMLFLIGQSDLVFLEVAVAPAST